jgi:uncharacterized protein (TIGR01777 family)
MKVFISGVSGFVGRPLALALLEAGHQVTGTGQRHGPQGLTHPRLTYLAADTTRGGDWQRSVSDADVVINLAGATIARRWTRKYKQILQASRIQTTRHLVSAMGGQGGQVLLSASAIGYYGDGGEARLTEAAPPGDDFLARLAQDWEAEAMKAAEQGGRVCRLRFGVVLGSGGGALAQMLPAFRSGLGGPLGSGRQWFSWIDLQDLIDAIRFVMDAPHLEGAFNLSAPEPVRQKDFARELARRLGRPALLPAPAAMLRLALGEMAGTLLASYRVVPQRLLQAGFHFRWGTLDKTLDRLVG